MTKLSRKSEAVCAEDRQVNDLRCSTLSCEIAGTVNEEANATLMPDLHLEAQSRHLVTATISKKEQFPFNGFLLIYIHGHDEEY